MLVHYSLVPTGDLQKALARQSATARCLGEIILEMWLVTANQLFEVLKAQAARREHASFRVVAPFD
jgi:hypothetical protein